MSEPEITDEQREARICELGDAIVRADSSISRAIYWSEMRELILGRSEAQIQRMEEQKRLK